MGSGSLRKIIIPSPAKCSSVPPCATITAPISRWYSRRTSRTSSGSAASAKEVKPRRSQNTVVTSRRWPARSFSPSGAETRLSDGRRQVPGELVALALDGPEEATLSMTIARLVRKGPDQIDLVVARTVGLHDGPALRRRPSGLLPDRDAHERPESDDLAGPPPTYTTDRSPCHRSGLPHQRGRPARRSCPGSAASRSRARRRAPSGRHPHRRHRPVEPLARRDEDHGHVGVSQLRHVLDDDA